MQAVILAAGIGKRLARVSGGSPKCLIEIGGRLLIEHQLEALADAGVGYVLIVVGYKAEEVRRAVGRRASFIENANFKKTNSLYSLWLAREWVTGPFVLLNSDLFFDPEILHRLLARHGNAIAFDSSSGAGQEQTKVAVRNGFVVDLGKDLPAELSRGESLGLMSFDRKGAAALFSSANAMIKKEGKTSWVMEAVRATCASAKIRAVNIAGLPWAEIDFPYDLERAEKEVWPAVHKGRWKGTIRWWKTRWIAALLGALILLSIGWFVNSFLREKGIEWATIAPTHGKELILPVAGGAQTWWLASANDSLEADVHGPSRVRVDVRLLLLGRSNLSPMKYVIQVTVNGSPFAWEVFKVTPDEKIQIDNYLVGDRDNIEFELPEGNHRVGVTVIAGVGKTLLVRIRQAEPSIPDDDDEEIRIEQP